MSQAPVPTASRDNTLRDDNGSSRSFRIRSFLLVTVWELTTADATPALTGTVNDPTATVDVTIAGRVYRAVNHGDGT